MKNRVLKLQSRQFFRKIPTLPEYIPSDTRELIKKMLQKDPKNRPAIT
jgi:hypothetical protein